MNCQLCLHGNTAMYETLTYIFREYTYNRKARNLPVAIVQTAN